MGRILAIDYGARRCGLAWTDPLKLTAQGIPTIEETILRAHLDKLIAQENIEQILLGFPTRMDGSDTHVTQAVRDLETWLTQTHPTIPVKRWDERLTSSMASRALIDAGVSKKKRREKGLVDQMAATMMLQEYLTTF
ncbi:MAG: Holliday junction resolvase RuvX [Bacteroidia bacterium]|nr:Holliday junction resolvase RuvX [Bacteroidia bacterium]